VRSINAVQPLHVSAYVEQLARERSAPTVKQRLAAVRHLFDWKTPPSTKPPGDNHLSVSLLLSLA
jgi:hypothetical protein